MKWICPIKNDITGFVSEMKHVFYRNMQSGLVTCLLEKSKLFGQIRFVWFPLHISD
jgi:hypothetical protein